MIKLVFQMLFKIYQKKVDELNKNPNPLTMQRVMDKAYQYTKKQI